MLLAEEDNGESTKEAQARDVLTEQAREELREEEQDPPQHGVRGRPSMRDQPPATPPPPNR
jgi:hypothetical protein